MNELLHPGRVLLFTSVLLLVFATPAAAADVRQGEVVTVGPNETIEDDLYALGGSISILGTVRGDVIAFGGSVTVDGVVTGDLIAAGGATIVRGQVGGSVRVGAGSVLIDGRVGEDVLAGSGDLILGASARIGRDVLAGTGSARLSGAVGRHVRVGAGSIELDGSVGGDVIAQVDTLRLTERAVVGGSLTYESDREAAVSSGAVVRGRVERRVPARAGEPDPASRVTGAAVDWLRAVVGFLGLGLALVLLAPAFARRTAETLVVSPWSTLGIGAVVLVGMPTAILLTFILGLFIGGWWAAFVVLALYAAALVLSVPVTALWLGRSILARVGRGDRDLVWALVVGLPLLLLASLVPVTGGIAILLAILFGLGALARAARRDPRPAPAAA